MNHNTTSKTGLFLMELILSILFFSLAGVVCVQMFVYSHTVSQDSVKLNHAVEWCQNVAEAFYGCEGNQTEMLSLFNDNSVLLFDQDFQPLFESTNDDSDTLTNVDFSYFITIDFSQQDNLLHCHIKAFEGKDLSSKKLIYELDNTYYSGKESLHE